MTAVLKLDAARISPGQVALSVLIVLILRFLWKLVSHRQRWRSLNLPGPPHSFVLGHSGVLGEWKSRFPADAPLDITMDALSREYGGVIFLDLWPFVRPMCIVADGNVADKVARIDNLPKPLDMMTVDYPILGRQSIVMAGSDPVGEAHWKALRTAFSPAFKRGHLERTWTSAILDEVDEYLKQLSERSKDGKTFALQDYITDTTADIILKVTLGVLNRDHRKRILAILRRQIANAASTNHLFPLVDALNPVRRYGEWKRTRDMDNEYKASIASHLKAAREGELDDKERKDTLDWVLRDPERFDHTTIVANLKTIVLGGFDTISSTLSWALYHAYTDPAILDRVRRECDASLGSPDKAKDLIASNIGVLNELKYTMAVIRESLRMHPAASAARGGPPDYQIIHEGRSYPLNGSFVWLCHYAIHRNPRYWKDPDTFRPERWLDEGGELIPAPLFWQPFSRGPRNCLGLELALLEQKIILALTVQRFDLTYADKEAPHTAYRLTNNPHNKIPMRVSDRLMK